jgi:hypothetical protein
MSIN